MKEKKSKRKGEKRKHRKKEGPEYPGEGAAITSAAGPNLSASQKKFPRTLNGGEYIPGT